MKRTNNNDKNMNAEETALSRILTKLKAHKEHYGTQFPQLERWIKDEMEQPPQKPEVSEVENDDWEELPSCPECGEMDLAYLEQYANGSEYRCRECQHTFIA